MDVDAFAFVLPGKLAWALKTTTYFGLWYFFNIFYNVANKKVLNALNLPWMQSLVCVGKVPRISKASSFKDIFHKFLSVVCLLANQMLVMLPDSGTGAAVGVPYILLLWATKTQEPPVLTSKQVSITWRIEQTKILHLLDAQMIFLAGRIGRL